MSRAPTPKRKLFEHLARVAKALAHPGRLELLEALAQGERSVEALGASVGKSVANTSHHLQVLREGGLVRSRKEGLQVFYSLSDSQTPVALLTALQRVGELHLAEIDRIVREQLAHGEGLTPVRREELLRLVRTKRAIVIDVRPPAEYRAGHIRGAINVPLEAFPRKLRQFSRDREIVAYCRGPYCMLAVDAVKKLRRRGFHARRLEDGYPEWRARRLPVDADE